MVNYNTSQKSRANNLIGLVEFLPKLTSNNGFQLYLNVLLIELGAISRYGLSFSVRAHQFIL